MTITLAPMEGVVDVHMRDMLTRITGFDLCVTEFVRVSQVVAPREWFLKYCPELENNSLTKSGIPVHVQLMGGEADVMADNAAFAAHELGAIGIDLNFGCPAKTVNRHMAGAALLQWPEKLYEITHGVKQAINGASPLSAKMRLGFEDKSLALENAQSLEEAGAEKLTVHARTKLEGYKAPAHWEWIARIIEVVDIPVVANGEIWTPEDAQKCREISGCNDIMIGRGAIARPSLAREIKGGEFAQWPEMLGWLKIYCEIMIGAKRPKWGEGRMKQWIKLLGRTYPEAKLMFDKIKKQRDPVVILQMVSEELGEVQNVA
ncbi:tRNA-dihydrouridine synthase C [Candidatus Terasakiella magnetica]|uniref:tRNA-dihydrouridine(16) synthase n=1 Tax=Candidatus Terasakiella magnetica TaxID=1867952 RepID=A0A1C3RFZ8_9PROT|nr:tRNA-dihydrouridine synthase family protein [Candidatus Terasakiella magnetica]SCA56178.1 tRNA-dihydrouridine synthase C [Candidatus Terasakiella magnetica]